MYRYKVCYSMLITVRCEYNLKSDEHEYNQREKGGCTTGVVLDMGFIAVSYTNPLEEPSRERPAKTAESACLLNRFRTRLLDRSHRLV